ncbi:MAG TPA: hypothetical protein VM261_01895 [Kofleriaceae bacterium]|nr:hypothetical protein [Kofleriaceae bacterium]
MHRIVVAVVIALGMLACGGTSSPPQTAGSAAASGTGEPATTVAGDKGELMLSKMREYKTTVCECKDAACIETAQKEIMDWAVAHADELKDVKPSAEQDAEADRLDGEIEACESKLTGSASAGGGGASGGGTSGGGATITAAEILAKMAEYKNRVCACKDSACVDKVEIEMGEWARANMESMMALTPTKAEDAEADKIQADMTACREKLEKKK